MAMLHSIDPRSGAILGSQPESTVTDAVRAVSAADDIAKSGVFEDVRVRAAALRSLAGGLRDGAAELIARCDAETGLPGSRLEAELERTWRQLDAFGDMAEAGAFFDAIIDTADSSVRPAPRPDLRRMLLPIGPVAVFGAGNFPLAFGVLGGDTASALAAGCPVVVKGHPSHPATNELVHRLAHSALTAADLPPGILNLVQGADLGLGEALADAPAVAAIAFTGSLAGGRALFDRAARRAEPIPVFAEMGSVNPLVVTPEALDRRGEEVAVGLVASVSGSAGQLCTKPGLVFYPGTESGRHFQQNVAELLDESSPGVMLDHRIWRGLRAALPALEDAGAVLLTTKGPIDGAGYAMRAAAYGATTEHFIRDRRLSEEYFGPVVVLVEYRSERDLQDALSTLEGQLTATIHSGPDDAELLQRLVSVVRTRVGRLVFDQFPTGVAVSWAQQHGGPYPATTASATTSVGMTAAYRFLRPVTYQGAPADVLPAALQDANPLKIWRRLNGELSKQAVGR